MLSRASPRFRPIHLAVPLCLLIPSPAASDNHGLTNVRIPLATPPNSAIDGFLLRPRGKGPFPAIVALHGCGGLWRRDGTLTARHADWGERLRAWGYVVLFPSSYGSRGYTNLCKKKKRPVKYSHRIGDLRSAADWLATQPFVDATKIALLGWSNGGSTLLRALAPGKVPGKTEFRTAIAFYPGCRTVVKKFKWRPRLKPLILMGAADDWTPPGPCRQLAKRWGAQIVLYKGAYHGFDAPNSRVRVLKGRAYSARGDGIVHWGTHPQARRAAIADIRNHLTAIFGASR